MAHQNGRKQRASTPREEEMVERARANPSLMEQAAAALAAHKRGERGTPGPSVQQEAGARRDHV